MPVLIGFRGLGIIYKCFYCLEVWFAWFVGKESLTVLSNNSINASFYLLNSLYTLKSAGLVK